MCTDCKKKNCQGCRGPRGPRGPKGDPGTPGQSSVALAPSAVFKQDPTVYNFDLPLDNNVGVGTLVVPYNTNIAFSNLEITVPENGDYLAFIEFSPYSTYNFSWNYQLLVDSVPVANSARGVLIDGKTPPLITQLVNSQQALPGLTAGQKVNVQFKTITFSGGSPTPSPGVGNSFLPIAALIITKVTLS